MIARRVLFVIASVTALAVSAGVIVVALAYALYALVKPALGPAGAAGAVAGAAALLLLLLGLILGLAGRPPKRRKRDTDNFIDQVIEVVKERPVTTVVGALAAGLVVMSNPRYMGGLVRSFLEGREPPRNRR